MSKKNAAMAAYLPIPPELSGAWMPDHPVMLAHGRSARDLTDDTHKANLRIAVAAERFWRAIQPVLATHSPLAIGRTVQKKPVRWLVWAYIAWQTDRWNREKISASTLKKAMTLLHAVSPGGSLELIGSTEVRRAARATQEALVAAGNAPGALIQLTDLDGFLCRQGWYGGDGFLSSLTRQQLVLLRSGLSRKDRQVHPRWPSCDDVALMLAACQDERDRRILSLLAWQGMRYGEALALDWADVRFDADGAWLRVCATMTGQSKRQMRRKNGSAAYMSRARPDVLAWLEAVPECERHGQVVGGARYNRNTAPFFRAAIAAGNIGHPHNLRRHFAMRLLAGGVPVSDIAQAMGDTEEVVRKTYLPADVLAVDRRRDCM